MEKPAATHGKHQCPNASSDRMHFNIQSQVCMMDVASPLRTDILRCQIEDYHKQAGVHPGSPSIQCLQKQSYLTS